MSDLQEAIDNKTTIVCQIDNKQVHSIEVHISKNHPSWTMARYRKEYPEAPVLSAFAQHLLDQNKAKRAAQALAAGDVVATPSSKGLFHEVFGLGKVKAAMSSVGGHPIEVTLLKEHHPDTLPYMVEIDDNYVYNIDLAKKVMIGFELNMATYLWGYHGTGKTTMFEQVAGRLRRPFMRVQHTQNTEESHILGQWVVKSKEIDEHSVDSNGVKTVTKKIVTGTEFQLGPLPLAMIHGMTYCADEYDVAMPGVIAVYQPVLERKNLVIKDAPPEYRVIKPHPEFRFCATGNTNGVGDESGLYQGTLIQNAAAYSRFKITEEVEYMDAKIEEAILVSQTAVDRDDAAKVVKFANAIRDQFAKGLMSMTVSPRELISACEIGLVFGGDFLLGIKLAFLNRCSRVDKKTGVEFAQRFFG